MSGSWLVRHAEAGIRKAWTKPDELRPLTAQGWEQADALAQLLAGAPFARLVSSPYVRCVQSLEPLAKRRGMAIEASDELAERAGGRGVVSLLSAGAVVACTHGDVVEAALDLLAAAGVDLPDRPRETPKGAMWEFEVVDGALGSAVYTPPP